MSIEQQLVFLFSALGAFNGISLSCYFLLIKGEKRLSDYFLGGLLLMLSIRIFKSVFLFFNPKLYQLFVHIGMSVCMLIGPYLYVVSKYGFLKSQFVEYIYKFWVVCILASVYHLTGVFNKLFGPKEKISDYEISLFTISVGVSIIYFAYEIAYYTSYLVGMFSFSFVFYVSLTLYTFKRRNHEWNFKYSPKR